MLSSAYLNLSIPLALSAARPFPYCPTHLSCHFRNFWSKIFVKIYLLSDFFYSWSWFCTTFSSSLNFWVYSKFPIANSPLRTSLLHSGHALFGVTKLWLALNSSNAFNFSPIINYLALPLSVLILCLIYASSFSPTNLQADDKEPELVVRHYHSAECW